MTSLDWVNQERTEFYLGRENQFVKVFNSADHVLTNNILLSGIPVGCRKLSK